MRTLPRLLFPCAMLLGSLSASSQWTQTNGPYGGYVSCFAVGEGSVIAGTLGGGVFLSSDKGATWSSVNSGLTFKFVRALIAISSQIGPPRLYAGTAGGGVFVSTNEGAQWIAADSGISSSFIYSFASSGSFLFAGTQSGVSLSTDGGLHWKGVGPAAAVRAVIAYNDSGRINLLVGTTGGISASIDTGATWTALNGGLTSPTVYALTLNLSPGGGSYLLAGTVGGGVFLSTDRGIRWSESNAGLTARQVYALARDSTGSVAYAGTFDGGVFRSSDNGTNWTTVNTGLVHRAVLSLAVGMVDGHSPYLLAGTNGGGVFLSVDEDIQWISSSTGLLRVDINSLGSIGAGERLLAGTVGSGIFQSTDGGNGWYPASEGLASYDVRAFAVAGDSISGLTIFAGTSGGGIFRSAADSLVWRDANSGLNDSVKDFKVYAVAVSDTNVFAATADGVFLSTNGGDSWNVGGLTGLEVRALAVRPSPADTQEIFAGTQGGGIYRSTNDGASWNVRNTGLTNPAADYFVYAVAVNGSSLMAGTFGGVFVSSNSGSSWKKADSLVVYAFANDETTVYAGTNNRGVFRSTNSGNSWQSFGNGLTTPDVRALAVVDSMLYAGTYGGGVWRRPLREEVSSIQSTEELAKRFSLGQNYPNPFNPMTSIEYTLGEVSGQLSAVSKVRLVVYDLLGREIATIVRDIQVPGKYSVQFDGSRLSSGVYFYRLLTEPGQGELQMTKRMVLLK